MRDKHVSLDAAVVEKADFLTLQGAVWSRAAGRGPVDLESSRNGRNLWVAQTFGKGGGSHAWSLWGLRGWGKGRVSGSVLWVGLGVC